MPVLPRPRAPRILDFDIENRPLSYWYGDACTAEITAIAWSFLDTDEIECYVLTKDPASMDRMLTAFCVAYNEADVVTGHYIRKHDLPIGQAALIERGLEPLGDKLASDTKLDLVRFSELSKSQEALGAMLALDAPKVQMSQSDWRQGNRLEPEGIERTVERVVGDVRQHMELRAALVARGMLRAPRWWRSGVDSIRPGA